VPPDGSSGRPIPHADLPADEKAVLAGSFGAVATDYERYRPGPAVAAVDWYLPGPVDRAVDLGAGTGALTRLLTGRAAEVVAVEPDDRMRAVLASEVPSARAVQGTGESIPLDDRWADAVLASTSWHWMDPVPTLHEVGRVLAPGGVFGALWTGPDPEGHFVAQARALMSDRLGSASGSATGTLAGIVGWDQQDAMVLGIPPGVPFDQPEHERFTWEIALDADDLLGLLGTLSRVITMEVPARDAVFAEARRLLGALGIEGRVTVDVAFRTDAWRARRHN